MGDVEDTEDSLALARGQGHMRPWLQEDGSGVPCASQEPVQVGGLMARDESEVQHAARHLQPGVQAQGPGDCREAGDRSCWGRNLGSSRGLSPHLPPHSLPAQQFLVSFCPWVSMAAAVQPARPHLSLGTTQGNVLTHDLPSSSEGTFSPLWVCFRNPVSISLTAQVPSSGPVICCDD